MCPEQSVSYLSGSTQSVSGHRRCACWLDLAPADACWTQCSVSGRREYRILERPSCACAIAYCLGHSKVYANGFRSCKSTALRRQGFLHSRRIFSASLQVCRRTSRFATKVLFIRMYVHDTVVAAFHLANHGPRSKNLEKSIRGACLTLE